MKLSERLGIHAQDCALASQEDNDMVLSFHQLADLADALAVAAQIARRVEEAPRCLICDEGDYLSAIPSDGESFITAGRLVGQRVRLVREE